MKETKKLDRKTIFTLALLSATILVGCALGLIMNANLLSVGISTGEATPTQIENWMDRGNNLFIAFVTMSGMFVALLVLDHHWEKKGIYA